MFIWGMRGGIWLDGCLKFEPSVTLLWFQTPDIHPTKVLPPTPHEHIAICSIIPWYGCQPGWETC
jgi:hypothetical protein